MGRIMSTSPDRSRFGQTTSSPRLRALAAAALLFACELGAAAFAVTDHTAGFTRYAHVDRSDGAYREVLVDDATLAALRAGRGIRDGATILMESYYSPGTIGSIFAKRRDGGRWLYGSFQPGAALPAFAPRPQCAACHRAAEKSDGTFTAAMLERFVETGSIQRIACDRAGRTPCDPATYTYTP